MLPEGIVSTDAPATIAVAERVGLRMDQWQKDITRITEARLGDGSRACDFVCLSIPRQAGKTWVVAAIVLAICLRRPTTVAWTAHHNKVMLETFRSLKSLAETELLKPHVLKVNSSAEDRSITFANGSRLVMAARESGALRGVARLDAWFSTRRRSCPSRAWLTSCRRRMLRSSR